MIRTVLATVLALITLPLAITGCGVAGTLATATTDPSPATHEAVASTVVVTKTVVVISTVLVPTTISTTSTSASQMETVSLTSVSASTMSIRPHMTPTPLPISLAPGAASDVVLAFLKALEVDSSGQTSMSYLSTRLQGLVRDGHSVESILGVSGIYSRYHADAAIARGGGRAATVATTLTYPSGPVDRLFTLVPQGGAWRIDDIAPTSA